MDAFNSEIIYPTVPEGEEDPSARVNVMIDKFQAELPPRNPPSPFNHGFLHEIFVAMHLIHENKITHGRQISRPLTAIEKLASQKGNAQMILVRTGKGSTGSDNYRELDCVYEENGIVHVVEAKDTKSVDTSQVQVNASLIQKLNGRLVYALQPAQKNQAKALEVAYNKCFNVLQFPALQIIHVSHERKWAEEYFKTNDIRLGHMHTYEDDLQRQRMEEIGGEEWVNYKWDHNW